MIFDEAISNLDQQTAELFAQTINRLKGKVTMLFITHQVPKGLQVDEFGEGGYVSKIIAHRDAVGRWHPSKLRWAEMAQGITLPEAT